MNNYIIFFGGIAFMLFAGWNFWFIRKSYKKNMDSMQGFNKAAKNYIQAKTVCDIEIAQALSRGRECSKIPGCRCFAPFEACKSCHVTYNEDGSVRNVHIGGDK